MTNPIIASIRTWYLHPAQIWQPTTFIQNITYKKSRIINFSFSFISTDRSSTDFPSLYFWLFSWAVSWKKPIKITYSCKESTQNHVLYYYCLSILHISTPQLIHSQHRKYQQQCASQSSSFSLLSPHQRHSPYQMIGDMIITSNWDCKHLIF